MPTISKNQEYFITIAQQELHSFIMLGYIQDGNPKLFARIGKIYDVDAAAEGCNLVMGVKFFGGGLFARIADEGITRDATSTAIAYQAYSINFEQVKEFIGLISDLEREQMKNPCFNQSIRNIHKNDGMTEKEILNEEAIYSYVPRKEKGEHVTFKRKKLQDCQFTSSLSNIEIREFAQTSQMIRSDITCRTTSLNIIETILKVKTDISSHYLIAPKYKTTLVNGVPHASTFYILPPPPNVNQEHLTQQQIALLQKLYKRLELIPKLNSSSQQTRNKFEALKAIYKDILGENTLSATSLLHKILVHEQNRNQDLFIHRHTHFFRRLLPTSTTTQKLFYDIKEQLNKEITIERNITATQ
ncbi:MAG: hypothetical protein Q8M40_04740 [Legionella sp.]|nr:hypothetical protein [Legionella sp.]